MGKVVEADGGADGEVEALGEPLHGETDLDVGQGMGGVGQAGELGADHEGKGPVKGDIGEVDG